MNEELIQRFESLQIWGSGSSRAPHKPLLVLWALGRCLHGEPRLTEFNLVDTELRDLLSRFGPHRNTIHTEDPFWRLQNDRVWEIDRPECVRRTPDGSGGRRSDLRQYSIKGGLLEDDYAVFKSDPNLVFGIASTLVASHFPQSLHDEILEITLGDCRGLFDRGVANQGEWVISKRRRRDPYFRRRILETYGAHCAVCGFAGQFRGDPIAIDAAHIKWHEANGPAVIENGIPLCSLHHRLFDKGAFTITDDFNIVVAESLVGEVVTIALHQYHGQIPKGLTLSQLSTLDQGYLNWHSNEVFRMRDGVY